MSIKGKLIILWIALIVTFIQCTRVNSTYVFANTQQGVFLYENGNPVYFYQKEPKTPDGKAFFNNYLHPLFSIDGDTITEEFPSDHPHHRGIFWAWHQIYLNNKSIGDDWVRESISQEVVEIKTKINKNSSELNLSVIWKSSLYENSKPFVQEHSSIIVHQMENGIRKIDFEIDLRAIIPGVSIGGSNDEKGYGGFCIRIKQPKALCFTAEKGPVMADINQIIAGPWMDFSSPSGKHGEIEGITILCHPTTPNYPAPWIIRSTERSMQNIVFPGREKIELSVDKSTILHYRLILHKGGIDHFDMNKLQLEYDKIYSGKKAEN